MKNREGERVPKVTFRTRKDGDWQDVSTRALFDSKKVVLFALPGAFTPTCSATHLPRYEELVPEFTACGIDEVICLSVNDGFVMEAWGRDEGIERVRLLPDGNAEFTAAIGMLVDKENLGFGRRSWRYSMFINNGEIQKMFIEPEVEGDPFGTSDADTMLGYLDPEQAAKQSDVLVFSRPGCPHCIRAKDLLADRGFNYEEVPLGGEFSHRALQAATGATSVPQIYIDGKHIGGADDLERYFEGDAD